MRVGTLVGIILIVAGAIGLIFQRVSYTTDRAVMRAGPVQMRAEERHYVTIPTVLSGLAIVAGLVLVVAVRRAR
jgi:hypothetical protein